MANLEERVRRVLARRRQASGQSLAEVAAATGISASTLSRIEGGDRRVTVDALATLAEAYGTTAAAVLAEAAREDLLLLEHQPVELEGGLRGIVLRVDDDGRSLLRLQVPPRPGPLHGRAHPGTEWLHVLTGRLRLQVGDRQVVLKAGETAQFSTDQPHAFAGIGHTEVLTRFEPGAHRA